MTINAIYHSDICAFAVDAIRDHSRAEIAEQCATSGTTLNMAKRMFRRQASAERYAARYTDLKGVGVIDFAARRVAAFVNRCEARGISAYN